MSTDKPALNTSADTESAAAQQSEQRTYSSDEVDQIRKEAHDAAFAAARRTLKASAPRQQRQEAPSADPASAIGKMLADGALTPQQAAAMLAQLGQGSAEPDMPRPPPQSNAGAPQSLPIWERPSDPFSWTADDIARLEAAKGIRAARKIIRQKAEEAATRMTFKLPVGRQNRR